MAQKTCAVCRQTHERDDLLRFVVGENGLLYWDAEEKAPGRGFRICHASACLLDKRAAQVAWQNKASKTDAESPATVVQKALPSRILQQLGLTRRRGALVLGLDAVELWVKKNAAVAEPTHASLVLFRGASERTERSTRELLEPPVNQFVTLHELPNDLEEAGKALGAGEVAVVLFRHDAASRRLRAWLDLWAVLRSQPTPSAATNRSVNKTSQSAKPRGERRAQGAK